MSNKYSITDVGKSFEPNPLATDHYGFLCNADMSNPHTVLHFYRYGCFPWDNYRNIGAYFFPKKRYIIKPSLIKIPKSMRNLINQGKFTVTYDLAFEEVINNCRQQVRTGQQGTWITDTFIQTYTAIHALGLAHSVEVWQDGLLVGGLYGVSNGKIFSGESMFGKVSNATRYAMIHLAKKLEALDYNILDCQVKNDYLVTFGGEEIDDVVFYDLVKENMQIPMVPEKW